MVAAVLGIVTLAVAIAGGGGRSRRGPGDYAPELPPPIDDERTSPRGSRSLVADGDESY